MSNRNADTKIENYDGSEITYTEVVYSCERETKKINCHGNEPINLELCMKKPFSLEEWHKLKDEKLLKKMEENQKFSWLHSQDKPNMVFNFG